MTTMLPLADRIKSNPVPQVSYAGQPSAWGRVDAGSWAEMITEQFASVADADQLDYARQILADYDTVGKLIHPVGPSIVELQARLDTTPTPDGEPSAPAAIVVVVNGVSYRGEAVGKSTFKVATEAGAFTVTLRPRKAKDVAPADAPAIEGSAPCCPENEAIPCVGCLEARGEGSALADALDTPGGDAEDSVTDGDAIPVASFASDLLEAIAADDPAPIAPPAEVDALTWAWACLGRYRPVSDDHAIRFAEVITSDERIADYVGERIRAMVGHTLEELEARLAAKAPVREKAPERPVAPALPDPGQYTLSELVTGQAAMLRGVGGPVFALMADALDRLAADIVATGSVSCAMYEDRRGYLASQREDEIASRAWDAGYRHALAEACPVHC